MYQIISTRRAVRIVYITQYRGSTSTDRCRLDVNVRRSIGMLEHLYYTFESNMYSQVSSLQNRKKKKNHSSYKFTRGLESRRLKERSQASDTFCGWTGHCSCLSKCWSNFMAAYICPAKLHSSGVGSILEHQREFLLRATAAKTRWANMIPVISGR